MVTHLTEIFKTHDNLIGFDKVTFAELEVNKNLCHITGYDRMPTRGKRKCDIEAANRYYQITSIDNTVFVNVQDNYGVVIPRYVEHKDKTIDVVERLSHYYWAITTDNEKVKASSLHYKEIYRAIWSIVLYGDEKEPLPTYYHVHHKAFRWWNTIESTAVVCKKKHYDFHRGNGGTHQSGLYFNNVSAFEAFVKQLKKATAMAKDIKL